MMNKSLLNLAVLCGTASFGQLPNAIEIAPKMYPGWNLGNTLEGGGTDNVYTNNGGLGAEKAWQGTTTTIRAILLSSVSMVPTGVSSRIALFRKSTMPASACSTRPLMRRPSSAALSHMCGISTIRTATVQAALCVSSTAANRQYSTRTVWTESWRVQLLPPGVDLLPASVIRFLQLLNPQASIIR